MISVALIYLCCRTRVKIIWKNWLLLLKKKSEYLLSKFRCSLFRLSSLHQQEIITIAIREKGNPCIKKPSQHDISHFTWSRGSLCQSNVRVIFKVLTRWWKLMTVWAYSGSNRSATLLYLRTLVYGSYSINRVLCRGTRPYWYARRSDLLDFSFLGIDCELMCIFGNEGTFIRLLPNFS
jgi:hypothetical protein